MKLISYCVDVGSIPKGNFAWARVDGDGDTFDASRSSDIAALTEALAAELNDGRVVALGFESPLFVPVPEAPGELGTQRSGEKGRAWSGGPGGAVLPTGIAQMAWVLRKLRNLAPDTSAYTSWPEFENAGSGLYLWEAFVSHKAEPTKDYDDALAGARQLAEIASAGDPARESAVDDGQPWLSLLAAALLWSGWTTDLNLLRGSVPVIRAAVTSSE